MRRRKDRKLAPMHHKNLSLVAETQELKRYHFLESHVQKTMRRTTRKK